MSKLKIAIQKSGRLNEDSMQILKDVGISIDNGKDQLKASAKNFPLEISYLRNGDIPQYLKDGVVDVAIIGENVLLDTRTVLPLLKNWVSTCKVLWQAKRVTTICRNPQETIEGLPNTVSSLRKR